MRQKNGVPLTRLSWKYYFLRLRKIGNKKSKKNGDVKLVLLTVAESSLPPPRFSIFSHRKIKAQTRQLQAAIL
jgi:hypothetical protein